MKKHNILFISGIVTIILFSECVGAQPQKRANETAKNQSALKVESELANDTI